MKVGFDGPSVRGVRGAHGDFHARTAEAGGSMSCGSVRLCGLRDTWRPSDELRDSGRSHRLTASVSSLVTHTDSSVYLLHDH